MFFFATLTDGSSFIVNGLNFLYEILMDLFLFNMLLTGC